MKTIPEGFPGQQLYRLPESLRREHAKHPVLKNFYVTDIGHFPRAAGHEVRRPKGSPGSILIFCLEGRGWYSLGKSRRQTLERRQALVIPAGRAHAYGSEEERGWTLYWMHSAGPQAEALAAWLSREAPVLYVPEAEALLRAHEETWRAVTRARSETDSLLAATLGQHLLAGLHAARRSPAGKRRHSEERVVASLDWMREHCTEALTLAALARNAGLSVPHYCALFKAHTGRSPMRTLIDLRLRRACELLDGTPRPVQQIAADCGFESPYHFSRSFKAHMGLSPRAYRSSVHG